MTREEFKAIRQKISDGVATQTEKDAFMRFLRDDNRISETQYNDYKRGFDSDFALKACLAIGAELISIWAITKNK